MNKLLVSLLGIVFILTACQRDITDILPPTTDSTSEVDTVPPTTDSLIIASYGDDPLQNMNVYLPANRSSKTKTIIYLHGGAWYGGDKSEANETAIYFQKKGYCFVSMNYRLTKIPTNTNPAQMEDIKKVLDFISHNQAQWIIPENKICLFGGSAGAHLSLLYAYKYKEDTRVRCVISVSAPIDLTDSLMRTAVLQQYIEDFVGCTYSQNKEAYLEASPSHYLARNCVPTIFMHGTRDETVPYLEAVSAYNILNGYGVNTKLVLFDEGHDLSSKNNEIILDMEDFLKSAYN